MNIKSSYLSRFGSAMSRATKVLLILPALAAGLSLAGIAEPVEPYPNEKTFIIKSEKMKSLNGKPVRFVEYLETEPYKAIQAPSLAIIEQHKESFTDQDEKNLTTYKSVSSELLKRLKKLPAERQLISSYKHSNGKEIDYLLFLPENYDESKTYPVILSLHGTGGHSLDSILKVACNNVGPVIAALDKAKEFPCFIVVPQAKAKEIWGYGDERGKVTGRKWRADTHSNGDEVIGLLKNLETRYSIDSSRRYVFGQSMGGLGTLEMAINRPGIFAAAVPIVSVPYEPSASRLDCPAWIFTAELERIIENNVSKVDSNFNFFKAARAADKNVRLTMYCGYGHGCHQVVYHHPGLWEWLFSKKRNDQ